MQGQDFNDVEILANDSIYVFIETTVDIKDYAANAPEFLYNDQLLVDEQSVELITLVKDAIFLYPERENGFKEMIPLGSESLNETNEAVRCLSEFLYFGFSSLKNSVFAK